MDGMDEFLKIFGNITLANIIELIIALCFVVIILKRVKAYMDKKLTEEKKTKEMTDQILKATNRIPGLEKSIDNIKDTQSEIITRIEKVESENQRRERNSLRDKMNQSYRYFTSKDHNPLMQWTKLEHDAFEEQYEEYTAAGGNSYIKETVKPAMDALEVIPMTDSEAITTLMHSRK